MIIFITSLPVVKLFSFIWVKENDWPFYLDALARNKVLIRGNHDLKEYSKATRHYFQDIKDYKEVTDGNKRVILSHYPMPFHHYGFAEKCWMFYGHVHVTRENDYLQKLRTELNAAWRQVGDPRGNFINVGCMMPWMKLPCSSGCCWQQLPSPRLSCLGCIGETVLINTGLRKILKTGEQ